MIITLNHFKTQHFNILDLWRKEKRVIWKLEIVWRHNFDPCCGHREQYTKHWNERLHLN